MPWKRGEDAKQVKSIPTKVLGGKLNRMTVDSGSGLAAAGWLGAAVAAVVVVAVTGAVEGEAVVVEAVVVAGVVFLSKGIRRGVNAGDLGVCWVGDGLGG
jgi:hypothetical protein